MAVAIFKGNSTAKKGAQAIGDVRSISINNTMGTWDITAGDTTTGRAYLGTWSDGTCTITGVADPADTGQLAAEADIKDGSVDTYTMTFQGVHTWSASCIATEYSLEGDYEGGWTFSLTLQKSGDATWAHV